MCAVRRNSITNKIEKLPLAFYGALHLLPQNSTPQKNKITMEADATTDTIMTDEVMTEQPPAAAAMETEDEAPPARLMITKMVRRFF